MNVLQRPLKSLDMKTSNNKSISGYYSCFGIVRSFVIEHLCVFDYVKQTCIPV